MRIISQVVPQRLRDRLRKQFDRVYCRSLPDKETIGSASQWTIVTRDMRPDAVIYSGGVGGDISFEQELIRRFGVGIHIFDPSPAAKQTIAGARSEHLHFQSIGLSRSGEAKFSVGGGRGGTIWYKAGGSNSMPCTSLPFEMEKNGHHSIDLLKIDIEGFEYEVLESCLARNIPIKQICVEFHHFYPEIPKSKTTAMIGELKSHGFDLIHKHRYDHTFLQRQ